MSALLLLRSPRIGRVVAVTLLWITRTLLSLLVACPLVLAITATGLASGPERDATLFRPGALILLELARSAAPLLSSALKTALLLWAACATLALVPLGAALDLLKCQVPDALGSRISRGLALFPRFVALSTITLLGQAALVVAASLLDGASSAALQGHDERLSTLAPVLWFSLAVLCCGWLGAVQDVSRAVIVQSDLGARSALSEALRILRRDPLSVLLGCYPSSAGSAFAWLAAAWVVTKLDLSVPSPQNVAFAFLVHQAAVLLSLVLRVRWLEGALALSAPPRDTSARD